MKKSQDPRPDPETPALIRRLAGGDADPAPDQPQPVSTQTVADATAEVARESSQGAERLGFVETFLRSTKNAAAGLFLKSHAEEFEKFESELLLKDRLEREMQPLVERVRDGAMTAEQLTHYFSSFRDLDVPRSIVDNLFRLPRGQWGEALNEIVRADFIRTHLDSILAQVQSRFISGPERDLADWKKRNASDLKRLGII